MCMDLIADPLSYFNHHEQTQGDPADHQPLTERKRHDPEQITQPRDKEWQDRCEETGQHRPDEGHIGR